MRKQMMLAFVFFTLPMLFSCNPDDLVQCREKSGQVLCWKGCGKCSYCASGWRCVQTADCDGFCVRQALATDRSGAWVVDRQMTEQFPAEENGLIGLPASQ